jgi:hypothetical protein
LAREQPYIIAETTQRSTDDFGQHTAVASLSAAYPEFGPGLDAGY